MQRELSLYYEQNKKSGFYPRMLQAKHNSLVTRSVDRSYLDNMLSKPLIYYQLYTHNFTARTIRLFCDR